MQWGGLAPTYAFESKTGENIVISVTAGNGLGLEQPQTKYELTDAAEKVVDRGEIQWGTAAHPIDRHPLELKVKKPGVYYFTQSGSGGVTACNWIPTQYPCTIVVKNEIYFHGGAMPPLNFYVPKGTKKIYYYYLYTPGGTHKVHHPDGKTVDDVANSRAIHCVEVHENEDGRLWHFSDVVLGQLVFFNIPNFVSPFQELMLPREVVTQDKLVHTK
jgi:hypothetical protein